ncbi:heterokaryon incompatibility protein-domain-containing protein [Xylariales sp. AK1849]|nr:heterokaryon incompatibility protein-domain-containing protein [Xylariales sp. AK1849]
MFRWHKPGCRRPDISVAGGIVFCGQCEQDSASCVSSLQQYSLDTGRESQETSMRPLTWPSSVNYTRAAREVEEQTKFGNYVAGKAHISTSQNIDSPGNISYTPIIGSGMETGGMRYQSRRIARAAIQALQHKHEVSYQVDDDHRLLIWIDAICINQRNVQERSHQVEMMRDIYAKANEVSVFLGAKRDDSKYAIERLNQYQIQRVVELLTVNSEDHDSRLKAAMCALFHRRYFSRVWVIQEILVGWASKPRPRGAGDLLQLLKDSLTCSSTDPRDKVFALLGLYENSATEGLEVDYGLSLREVYTGITAYFLMVHQEIDILSLASGISDLLPSWVPDWSNSERGLLLPGPGSMPIRATLDKDEVGDAKRVHLHGTDGTAAIPILATWPVETT